MPTKTEAQQLREDVKELSRMNCARLSDLHELEQRLRRADTEANAAEARANQVCREEVELREQYTRAIEGQRCQLDDASAALSCASSDAGREVHEAMQELNHVNSLFHKQSEQIAVLGQELTALSREEEARAPRRAQKVYELERLNSILVAENSLLAKKLARAQPFPNQESSPRRLLRDENGQHSQGSFDPLAEPEAQPQGAASIPGSLSGSAAHILAQPSTEGSPTRDSSAKFSIPSRSLTRAR